VVSYLPSPVDVPAISGIDVKTGGETTRESSDDAPLSMLAFKMRKLFMKLSLLLNQDVQDRF
ncbi:hypothetical protein, partial [Bartonella koehlerae]|uniref:hypothetical protein n=1 Tax=Bartonella koehlerae TaxID=92181 RepID=UPI001ABAD40C